MYHHTPNKQTNNNKHKTENWKKMATTMTTKPDRRIVINADGEKIYIIRRKKTLSEPCQVVVVKKTVNRRKKTTITKPESDYLVVNKATIVFQQQFIIEKLQELLGHQDMNNVLLTTPKLKYLKKIFF